MSWQYKVKIKELIEFCRDWRSRQDLVNEFNLSNTESWHVSKFMKSRPADFEFRDEKSRGGRKFLFKSRKSTLEDLVTENKEEE